MTYLEFITDGDNVQAQSPLDGALVPNSSDAMGGADKEGSSSKRPGDETGVNWICLLYTSPSPRDQRGSRMPSSA